MASAKKVIVLGLDGLDPNVTDALLAARRLPNLAALRERGGYARVATTTPPQTPVAWSSFATGVNPGGHGIFDFLRRDPATYLPDIALNRYEQKSSLLPPRVVNLRRGAAIWDVLGKAGIPSTVIRCPCTYPPDTMRGRMIAGLGVPDIRGGLGTSTWYTSARDSSVRESEQVVELVGDGDVFRTQVIGPRNPRTRGDVTCDITIRVDRAGHRVLVESDGEPNALEARRGEWSSWLRLKFRSGMLQRTAGMLRFLLVRLDPHVELYASPVNFDPAEPPFPISHPWEYANELSEKVGLFHTAGVVEDHTGLANERFGENAFLAQCDDAMRERREMLFFELERMREGFLFCLFDTPDRIQHMFWRFGEAGHPANRGTTANDADLAMVIGRHYEECDRLVGDVLARAGDDALVIVLSDHGFGSFRRGVHLNAWLLEQGYLQLAPGVAAGYEAGEFLRRVDWGRTRAYALGMGSIYLNVKGREAEGVVDASEADTVADEIACRLTGLTDTACGSVAVIRARTRASLYQGPFAGESPDVVVDCAAGYRVSWTTALGGVPATLFEDNLRKWGGDHIVDPSLVPGVLFMNRRFGGGDARLVDLAPTVLAVLGVRPHPAMEGNSLM